MNYLISFFRLSHLFYLRPQPMVLRGLIILIAINCLIIALGVAGFLAAPKIKDGLKVKGIRKIVHLTLTMGIIGLVYSFFAWQGVAFLAARFWILVWAIVILAWGAFIAQYFFLEVPKLRSRIEDKRKFDKYIP